MSGWSEKKARRERRNQALLRYRKHRQRNVLAQPGPHDFVLVLDSLKAGFNVPKIFRSADAFGARAVHLVDIGPFDPAPAKGGFKHVPAAFHDDFASCAATLQAEGYTLVALDPEAKQDLWQLELKSRTAFVLGHEEHGFSFDPTDYPELRWARIPQFGKVQSLNVSVAASIVMYEFVRARNTDDTTGAR